MRGAMLETKGYATSYIPTTGATSTRNADVCNNSGSAQDFNSEEGVLYAEISALANDITERSIGITSGDANNRILLQYKNISNTIQGLYRSGGINVGDCTFAVTDITEFLKIAFKYKTNDFALWINGVEVDTDTLGSTDAVGINALSFDRLNTNNTQFYGKVRNVQVFTEALTDEQLEKLTS